MIYDWSCDGAKTVVGRHALLTDPILHIEANIIEHHAKLGREPEYSLAWWGASGEVELQRRKGLDQ